MIYSKPEFADLTPQQAIKLAACYKNDPNYPYMGELFRLVMDTGRIENWIGWMRDVGAYEKDFMNKFCTAVNPMFYERFAEELPQYLDSLLNEITNFYSPFSFNFRAAVNWFTEIKINNTELKIRLIKADKVDIFIESLRGHYGLDEYYNTYSEEDFYADLPAEYQLGIMV